MAMAQQGGVSLVASFHNASPSEPGLADCSLVQAIGSAPTWSRTTILWRQQLTIYHQTTWRCSLFYSALLVWRWRYDCLLWGAAYSFEGDDVYVGVNIMLRLFNREIEIERGGYQTNCVHCDVSHAFHTTHLMALLLAVQICNDGRGNVIHVTSAITAEIEFESLAFPAGLFETCWLHRSQYKLFSLHMSVAGALSKFSRCRIHLGRVVLQHFTTPLPKC